MPFSCHHDIYARAIEAIDYGEWSSSTSRSDLSREQASELTREEAKRFVLSETEKYWWQYHALKAWLSLPLIGTRTLYFVRKYVWDFALPVGLAITSLAVMYGAMDIEGLKAYLPELVQQKA